MSVFSQVQKIIAFFTIQRIDIEIIMKLHVMRFFN